MIAPPPRFVEAEIGSYCNRRCRWCPNGHSTRGQCHEHVDPAVFGALLDGLQRMDYGGRFAFHNYNEPLLDPFLFERMAQTRQALPRAYFVLYSNGDPLTAPLLDQLAEQTVREVRVTLYPTAGKILAAPDAETIARFKQRLGLGQKGVTDVKPRKIQWRAQLRGLRLVVNAPRISRYTERCGSFRWRHQDGRDERTWPCYMPMQALAVDYHGAIKLCCHIYDSLDPDNRPYILGNVVDTRFDRVWHSTRLQKLRRQLAQADFTGLPMCSRCQHRMTPRMQRLVLATTTKIGLTWPDRSST